MVVGHCASSTARSRETESLSQSQPPQQVAGSCTSNVNLGIAFNGDKLTILAIYVCRCADMGAKKGILKCFQ